MIKFKDLNAGGIFYLPAHPGNTYRKVDQRTAEFTRHRLGNQFIGHRIQVGYRSVATSPEEPPAPTCLCCDREVHAEDLCWDCYLSSIRDSGLDLL